MGIRHWEGGRRERGTEGREREGREREREREREHKKSSPAWHIM